MTTTEIAPFTASRGASPARHARRSLLAPALTYIVLLVAVPFLLAVALSLTNSSAGSLDVSFVGLQNFRAVVASPRVPRSLANTFVFTFVSQFR